MPITEKSQSTKPSLPKRHMLTIVAAGVISLWKPVDTKPTLQAADTALSAARAACAKDKLLADTSRDVLLRSP